MNKKQNKYYILLIWNSTMIICAVLLYCRGFMLNRTVLESSSLCSRILNKNEITNISCAVPAPGQICFESNVKVIIILIDALRYDFMTFNNSNKSPLPFQNKMPIINELLNNSKNTGLFKFIADPPTTTMQRLSSLTTGSFPTFIDIGSNFATTEIKEDNLIDLLLKNNKKTIFMGDDTWMSLFPHHFSKAYPFPSFNVYDLYTVDNGVKEHLFDEINSDFDVIIAHFLGVDHCGHRYGPKHEKMSKKLKEMNDVILDISLKMDNNSLLIVMGDHGMTITGDHGGETDDEVSSALFVYSKRSLCKSNKSIEVMKQIDFVPTLSVLLGIPIPFSNLGIIIPEMLPIEFQPHLVQLFYENTKQITNYVKEYTKHNLFKSEIQNLTETFDNFCAGKSSIWDFKKYILKIRHICEETWIRFDINSMTAGIFYALISLFFTFINILILENMMNNLIIKFFIVTSLATVFAFITHSEIALYHFFLFISVIFFSVNYFQNYHLIVLKILRFKLHLLNVHSFLAIFLSGILMFSNSFIIYEAELISFLFTSLMFIFIFSQKLNFTSALEIFILLLINRSSSYFWPCQEHQSGNSCLDGKTITIYQFFLTSLPLVIFCNCDSYKLFKTRFYFVISLNLSLVISCLTWILDLKNIFSYKTGDIKIILSRLNFILLLILFISFFVVGKIDRVYFRNISKVIVCLFALILGIQRGCVTVLLIISLIVMQFVIENWNVSTFKENSNWFTVCWILSSRNYFFSTGHSNLFSSIQWNSAMILGSFNNLIISGTLVLLNTFLSEIIHSSAICFMLIIQANEMKFQKNENIVLDNIVNVLMKCTFFGGFRVCCAVMTTYVHSRHLMVWKIFAPKLIFESLSYIITQLTLIVTFILLENKISYNL